MTTDDNRQPPAATEPADELAELRAVVAKAKAGDASVLPQLREMLDNNPALVTYYGDLGQHAEAAWVALAAGRSLYLKETVARAAAARRAELTRPGAPPVERLLVERVVACDLQLGYLTTAEADALGAGESYRQLDFQAKRVERAQRMYLAALGALVAFQKLVPVPQAVAPVATPVLPTRTPSERAAAPPPATVAADRVPVPADDVDAEDERIEPQDRLRVGVTY